MPDWLSPNVSWSRVVCFPRICEASPVHNVTNPTETRANLKQTKKTVAIVFVGVIAIIGLVTLFGLL